MSPRLRQVALASGAAISVALLAACAPATPLQTGSAGSLAAEGPRAASTVAPSASPAPSAGASVGMSSAVEPATAETVAPIDESLLAISARAVSPDGRSIAVSLTLTEVAPITQEDLAAIAEASCDPLTDLSAFEDPDARMVTFDVEATTGPGTSAPSVQPDWTAPQGVDVIGLLFDGDIFASPLSSDSCTPSSLVVRAGIGTVEVPVSPEGWEMSGAIPVDGAVTLGQYGLRVLSADEFGQPTGLDEITDCVIEASSRLDELALTVAPAIGWGSMSTLPEYCLYGRMPTDG